MNLPTPDSGSMPVLVGWSIVTHRHPHPDRPRHAVDLMTDAATGAVQRAGVTGSAIDWVGVPEGSWTHPDAGREVAQRLGADSVRSVKALVGVLQDELLAAAFEAVRSGEATVALVVGGEAARTRRVTGSEPPVSSRSEDRPPDRELTFADLGVDDLEIIRDTVAPVTSFALIDSVLRHRRGLTPTQRVDEIAERYAHMARLAATHEWAWDSSAPQAAELADTRRSTPTGAPPSNPMICVPYGRRVCSQWTVDQAAALLVCSERAADELGVPPDGRVHPVGTAVCNHAVAVPARRHLDRSPGADAVVNALAAHLGEHPARADHLELYSCFPAAIDLWADALGVHPDARPVTVTGGMAFAGGPLNNAVIAGVAQLAETIRGTGDTGLTTSISAAFVKQGATFWTSAPSPTSWRYLDVTTDVAATDPALPLVPDLGPGGGTAGDWGGEPQGEPPGEPIVATIVAATVDHRGGGGRAVAIVERDGRRSIAATTQPGPVERIANLDLIGANATVTPDGVLLSC